MTPRPSSPEWNANIHYDTALARLARPGDRVLDVGCGDGFLSARLCDLGCRVTALDADAGVLRRAQPRWPDRDIAWLLADVLAYEPDQPYDLVVSNATLHHLPDTDAALRRLAHLVRPGGRLGIVGFARNAWYDVPWALTAQATVVVANRVRGKWEHSAPQSWPPPLTYAEVRRTAARVLPGSRFRRLWWGRFLLTWTAPV